MFMGERIFTWNQDTLELNFEPKLAGWMFDDNGNASFTFLSQCKVTYHNPSHKATYGKEAAKITKIVIVDTMEEIQEPILRGSLAEQVRSGEIKEIIVHLN